MLKFEINLTYGLLTCYVEFMNLKTYIAVVEKIWLTIAFVFTSAVLMGQQTPMSPISYWVFSPYIYNPAMVGSKDFLSIGLNAAFQGKSNTQLISGNSRISKTRSGYFSSPDLVEFKNLGAGGSVFKDIYGSSRNIGISISGSYHLQLNTRKLSFLSFGISVKGVSNTINKDSTGTENPEKKTFYPNLDLGMYYYGTSFFAGLSVTNAFGNPEKPDTLGIFKIPVSRQFFFTTGCKILISKSLNIVLEPSVLILADDSAFKQISDNINPIIRLYMEDFCFGTSFRKNGKISIFSQFRYPRFYIGAYYELPKKTPFFKKNPIVEFTLGINIQADKSRFPNHNHW